MHFVHIRFDVDGLGIFLACQLKEPVRFRRIALELRLIGKPRTGL